MSPGRHASHLSRGLSDRAAPASLYGLKWKWTTSPSLTTYSCPSVLTIAVRVHRGPRAVLHEVLVAHHLGLDESPLHVGVDLSRGPRGARAPGDRPRLELVVRARVVAHEPEELVAFLDESQLRAFVDPELLHELRFSPRRKGRRARPRASPIRRRRSSRRISRSPARIRGRGPPDRRIPY